MLAAVVAHEGAWEPCSRDAPRLHAPTWARVLVCTFLKQRKRPVGGGGGGVSRKESLLEGERGVRERGGDDLAWRALGAWSTEAWFQRVGWGRVMASPHLSASCDGCSGVCVFPGRCWTGLTPRFLYPRGRKLELGRT